MPNRTTSALLNDIGTEELSHLEMVSTIVHQLTRDLSMEEIEKSGFGPYYIDHTVGVWPQAAGGVPFNACEFQSKGDPITDLFEDLAAEQKARSTYDNILRVVRNIPEMRIPSNSCVPEKLFISRDLGKLFSPFRKNLMPKTSMLLPRDLIIPALHHATAINNVRSQNLRHTARIYAISIVKRVTENGMNSNTLHLKNHRNFIFALQIYPVVL